MGISGRLVLTKVFYLPIIRCRCAIITVVLQTWEYSMTGWLTLLTYSCVKSQMSHPAVRLTMSMQSSTLFCRNHVLFVVSDRTCKSLCHFALPALTCRAPEHSHQHAESSRPKSGLPTAVAAASKRFPRILWFNYIEGRQLVVLTRCRQRTHGALDSCSPSGTYIAILGK